jgi:tetratricopeptide (TPR) repeat protein
VLPSVKNSCGFFAAALLLTPSISAAQRAASPHPGESPMQQRYDAAISLLAKGDIQQAKIQYELFLADALHRVAIGRAEVGKYPEAAPLFDEALVLDPGNTALKMDYVEAALYAHDTAKVQRMAQQLLASFPPGSRDTRIPKLHSLLGQALLGVNDPLAARQQFLQAFAAKPSFENEFAVAEADLALLDKDSATKLFVKMLAQFGNSAHNHMQFGLAFARAEFPELAIPEFKKVVAMDGAMRDAHYCLGAAYLSRSGDTAFPQAAEEFHKELALHPDDFFSYYELGYEAMKLNHLDEAVSDLNRAAALNPHSDDTFLLLGELYGNMDKTAQQEVALRKAIQACTDPSKNHYQIRGAHYQLGLLLMQEGKTDEGKKEMQISENMLLQNRALDKANLTGESILRFPPPNADTVVDPKAIVQLDRFEQQVGPAIADSFNNLGVIAAQTDDFSAADVLFKQAAMWNPGMDDLDYNWGRAAFGAHDYRQAVDCLTRYMKAHPGDNRPRVALGMSEFELADYSSAVATLAPLGIQMDTVPLVAYAYAESLVKTGDTDHGISRLERLEDARPDLEIIPVALGAAFAHEKEYTKSEVQLRRALQLKPSDLQAKQDLASALLALGRQNEAEPLLVELAKSKSNDPAVFFQLGKLELDRGDQQDAIAHLEIAAKLAPQDHLVQQELARANQLQGRATGNAKK